jgi:hypothetical protein
MSLRLADAGDQEGKRRGLHAEPICAICRSPLVMTIGTSLLAGRPIRRQAAFPHATTR